MERLFDFIRKESTGRPARLDVQDDPISACRISRWLSVLHICNQPFFLRQESRF